MVFWIAKHWADSIPIQSAVSALAIMHLSSHLRQQIRIGDRTIWHWRAAALPDGSLRRSRSDDVHADVARRKIGGDCRISLGRWGEPEELAKLCFSYASDDSSYINTVNTSFKNGQPTVDQKTIPTTATTKVSVTVVNAPDRAGC
jgi:hypothetical protein